MDDLNKTNTVIAEEVPQTVKMHGSKINEVNFSCNVAGTTFVQNSKVILKHLKDEVTRQDISLKLTREPSNPYDRFAVIVEAVVKGDSNIYRLGYIPKDRAQLVSYALNHPERYEINTYNVDFFGGTDGKKNIGVFFEYHINDILGGLEGMSMASCVYEGQPVKCDFPDNVDDLENFFK